MPKKNSGRKFNYMEIYANQVNYPPSAINTGNNDYIAVVGGPIKQWMDEELLAIDLDASFKSVAAAGAERYLKHGKLISYRQSCGNDSSLSHHVRVHVALKAVACLLSSG